MTTSALRALRRPRAGDLVVTGDGNSRVLFVTERGRAVRVTAAQGGEETLRRGEHDTWTVLRVDGLAHMTAVARAFTPRQIELLDTAWRDVMGTDAYMKALAAMNEAQRAAGRLAATNARMPVVLAAALGRVPSVTTATRFAFECGARAALTADLAGSHGLTVAHLDTLLGPWRAVVEAS